LDWCHEFDKPLMLFFFGFGASPWFSRNHFSASRTIQLVRADGCSHTTVEPVVEFSF
jgi:hypothetical protein